MITTVYRPTGGAIAAMRDRLAHHTPFGDQAERYQANRTDVSMLCATLMTRCPPSQQLNDALDQLAHALMLANAAIAVNEIPPKATPATA